MSLLQRTDIETLLGKKVTDVVLPANREAVLEAYEDAFRGGQSRRELTRDNRVFEMSTVPIYSGDSVDSVLIFSFDVTDQRREAEQLREARDSLAQELALLEATVARMRDGVALLDGERRILLCNDAFREMFEISATDARRMPRERFLAHVLPMLENPEASLSASRLEGEISSLCEFTLARPRRRILQREWTGVPIGQGEHGVLVAWHDVTAERDLLREREQQLLFDALTGIPNRRAAEAALRVEREREFRMGTPLCVAIFDIDHFKRVNDEHGHAIGDRVLCAVATALAGERRLTDTIARWGGEEFVAVLNVSLEGARSFCERARKAVEQLTCPPVERITISAGIAQFAAGEGVSEALARADNELYRAKAAGRNRVEG